MSEKTQYHIQRLGTLRRDRGNFNTQWEEAAARLLPAHVSSFTSFGMSSGGVAGTEGQKKTELQFDSRAAFSAHRFSSVIESLVTPQNAIWHLMRPLDRLLRNNRRVRMFFDELSETLYNYRYRPAANFVGQSQQVYLGLGVYGNGVLYTDKPDDRKGTRYRNIHLGEAYFVENHQGLVDTLYRAFFMSARQIVQLFSKPGDHVPDHIREAVKNPTQMDQKFEVLHCVYPREDYDPYSPMPKAKRFASIYIFVSTQDLMRESGYNVFPYAVTRYAQASGETYGRGPAQMVLPSIKVLNEMKKTVLKQGNRVVDPVLLAHDDGNLGSFSMKAGSLNAGGVNKDGRPLVHVLPTGNIVIGDKLMDMEVSVQNDAFLVSLFQILLDTPQMTATEVLERAKEKGMLLAPTAGRIGSEFLGPLIEREIDVLSQQPGALPEMPPILLHALSTDYKIEYDNPLARMARAEKAAGFMRSLQMSAEYAKVTGDLESLDWYDFDVATPAIQDIMGSPTEWTRSSEDVAARRAARAQAQQQQQMVDAAPAIAALAKAAPTAPAARPALT